MNAPLLRSLLLTGLLIAAVNVIFAGVEYGFGNLPAWFWLAQLLLLPAMLGPLRLFPHVLAVRPYLARAGRFALGFAAPYAVMQFTERALRPDFSAGLTLFNVVFFCLLMGLFCAAIYKPRGGS
ncbi:hypothetical protein DEIPH_ctg017orf0069 [Deinococcus phoenicis]|uniref:Uncharacterized protein n=1 Tax=Deinococcus phoenicis TaxID=1476583 RepID=A0A016QRW8_9DEIO|nr:hypothetical protein [Deinococcus phoenicis]EYB68731.1 hypothetical protein DEIPH_ctg017orf0069 [Deinococcus phoenicis]